jgi:hypothetical protein
LRKTLIALALAASCNAAHADFVHPTTADTRFVACSEKFMAAHRFLPSIELSELNKLGAAWIKKCPTAGVSNDVLHLESYGFMHNTK